MLPLSIEKGDVVALSTHPYLLHDHEIIIGGEALHQAPLMVVGDITEIERKVESGETIRQPHFKCYWYSGKTNEFASCWLTDTFLRLIEKGTNLLDEVPDPGTPLILRTARLELKKRKGSLYNDTGSSDEGHSQISALLSFVPPLLLANGHPTKTIMRNDEKKSKRIEIDYEHLKAKWFNGQQNKYSESSLPIVCLQTLPIIDEEKLRTIRSIIERSTYMRIQLHNRWTFIRPLDIHFVSGFYYLRAYDVLTNKIISRLSLEQMRLVEEVSDIVTDRAPIFDLSKSKGPLVYPYHLLKKLPASAIVRIKYINRLSQPSLRCVTDIETFERKHDKTVDRFLKGRCLLKQAERNFNIERIDSVEVLRSPE